MEIERKTRNTGRGRTPVVVRRAVPDERRQVEALRRVVEFGRKGGKSKGPSL
jgi:hypothetical protein